MFLFTGVVIFITLLNIIVYYLRQNQEEEEDYGERKYPLSSLSDHLCRRFSLAEIQSATQNFDEALVIGKGGFGKVYKGTIDNGASTVAIKRLDFGSDQGAPEFWTEIEMLSKFRHSHLVSLIGYCNDDHEMIIVYEYMPGGTLEDNLHKILRLRSRNNFSLSWVRRLKICIGAARGLDYLHTGTSTQQRVIHRDVKSSNILLDENHEAKISDFGLCKIGPTNQPCTHVSTHVKGTFGYLDPEYFLTRRLTRKSDVYAFGVVLFEVLCGRPAVDVRLDEEQWGLAGWAKKCVKEGKVNEIVDPRLSGSILLSCLNTFAQIADQCLNNSSKMRPTMAEVITRLEFALSLQEVPNFSLMEAELTSTIGAYGNQEIANSSTEQDISIGGSGRDSNREHEVISSSSNRHNDGQIDGVTHFGGSSHVPSHIIPAKKITFMKKVRLLFSTKTPAVTGPSKNSDVLDGLESLQFDFNTVRVATHNFSDANKLGQGGYGPVYKGLLQSGLAIAVKRLSENSKQGELEFRNEVMLVGKLRHRNLVRLLGFCKEGIEKLLIYEFMCNGSLEHFIFDRYTHPSFGLEDCFKIIGGVARGLLYLHEDSPSRIIHRDIKPRNILLDGDYNPKISDFGLARSPQPGQTQLTTDTIMGTFGYIAPEYAQHGHFSVKSDVFSFGVLALEVVSGQKRNACVLGEYAEELLSYAWRNWSEGTPLNLVNRTLRGGPGFGDDIARCIQIGLLCVQEKADDRPSMGSVVHMLSSTSVNLPKPSKPAYSEQWSSISRMSEFQENTNYAEEVDYSQWRSEYAHYSGSREDSTKTPAVAGLSEVLDGLESFQFDFNTVRVATDNFSDANKIWHGPYSDPAFKGLLQSGVAIAVKRLSGNSNQGDLEFRNEVMLLGKLRHRNLVRLLGFCKEGNVKLLIYEFMCNGSLYMRYGRFLGFEDCFKIIEGVARGLLYLHEDSPSQIIHRDIKPRNILLDEEFNPKISDFGLARSLQPGQILFNLKLWTMSYHCSEYMAPEYAYNGNFSVKSDVFSFGVVALEVASGHTLNSLLHRDEFLSYAWRNWSEGTPLNLVNRTLRGGSGFGGDIVRCIQIGLLCVQKKAADRPTMGSVVHMLSSTSVNLPKPSKPAYSE